MILFSCQKSVPGNVYVFNGYLSMLNQKDMYPTDEIFESMFDFSETDSPIEHFETLSMVSSILMDCIDFFPELRYVISVCCNSVVETFFLCSTELDF